MLSNCRIETLAHFVKACRGLRFIGLVLMTSSLFFAQEKITQAPQATNGIVTGSVVDEAGLAVKGASVVLMRTAGPKINGAFYAKQAITDQTGSFVFNQLPAGFYRLCPQSSNRPFVEPCVWYDNPPAVSLGISEKKLGYRLVLKSGRLLNIRIDDDDIDKVLQKKNSKGEDLHRVKVELVAARGRRIEVPKVASDGDGQNHLIVVPIDTGFRLDLQSSTLDVKGKGDADKYHVNEGRVAPGQQISAAKQVDELTVKASEANRELRFAVKGKAK